MRWRQSWNEETKKYEFIPVDDAARQQAGVGAAVHGDIVSFVSPVDGTVISDRKQLREHNKRNDVVNSQEFSQEHYDRKAKERSDRGNTRQEVFARKQAMYDEIIKQERATQ
jgi:hypothetical protein